MIFLVVFICLALEFSYLSFAPMRSGKWVVSWHGWLGGMLRLRERVGAAFVLIAIALPCAGLVYVFERIVVDSSVLSLFVGVTVLLFSCGPGDLSRDIDDYIRNYEDQTDNESLLKAGVFASVDASPGDPDRPYIKHLVVAANDRIFAPVFWFTVLGPVGALLFRMSAVLAGDLPPATAEGRMVSRLYQIVLWLPARLLSLGLGLAGTLGPVIEILGRGGHGLEQTNAVLGEATIAALGAGRQPGTREDMHIALIEGTFNLVKRGFIIWLVVLGLLAAAGVV